MAAAKAKLRQQKVTDTDSGFLRRARLRKQVTRDKYAESWNSFLDYCVDHTLLPGRSSRFVTMHQLVCFGGFWRAPIPWRSFQVHSHMCLAECQHYCLSLLVDFCPNKFPIDKGCQEGLGELGARCFKRSLPL